jgi:hypothetical protein
MSKKQAFKKKITKKKKEIYKEQTLEDFIKF